MSWPGRLGLPLAEIGRALDDPAWSLSAAIDRHLRELDRRLEATSRLRSRLAGLLSSPGAVLAATASVAVMVDDVDAHFRTARAGDRAPAVR